MPVITGPEYNSASTRYIETTSQRMYHSDPAPGDMRLKKKYRAGWITAPKQNKHSDNQGRGVHKRKLNAKQKAALPPQPVMVRVVDLSKRTNRMMTATEFGKLSWGWRIE